MYDWNPQEAADHIHDMRIIQVGKPISKGNVFKNEVAISIARNGCQFSSIVVSDFEALIVIQNLTAWLASLCKEEVADD